MTQCFGAEPPIDAERATPARAHQRLKTEIRGDPQDVADELAPHQALPGARGRGERRGVARGMLAGRAASRRMIPGDADAPSASSAASFPRQRQHRGVGVEVIGRGLLEALVQPSPWPDLVYPFLGHPLDPLPSVVHDREGPVLVVLTLHTVAIRLAAPACRARQRAWGSMGSRWGGRIASLERCSNWYFIRFKEPWSRPSPGCRVRAGWHPRCDGLRDTRGLCVLSNS